MSFEIVRVSGRKMVGGWRGGGGLREVGAVGERGMYGRCSLVRTSCVRINVPDPYIIHCKSMIIVSFTLSFVYDMSSEPYYIK